MFARTRAKDVREPNPNPALGLERKRQARRDAPHRREIRRRSLVEGDIDAVSLWQGDRP